MDKAKESGMPKDNIERAIKRGTGEIEGAAIIIKAITDNKNRAASDIKYLLSENGGSLGGSGSVVWMFEQCGLIIISNEQLTK